MAAKSANVTTCVHPESKQQTEAILADTGMPGSAHIVPVRDSMTDMQFDAMIETGYRQAKSGQTIPLDEAFAQVREGL